MDVEHVDAEIVSREIHRSEYFLESHNFTALRTSDHLVGVILQCFLNEPEEMLLIHARRGVDVSVDLSNIVEITMGHGLLTGELAELVKQYVQLELGGQIAESPVAERLQRPVGDHRAEKVHVANECRQIGIGVRQRFLVSVILVVRVYVEDTVQRGYLVILRRRKLTLPWITPGGWGVHRMVWK